MIKVIGVVTMLFCTVSAELSGNKEKTMDCSALFGTHAGTFVLYDLNDSVYTIYNTERSRVRFSPFSTFKIPNSVIALETGVVKNVDTEFAWDTVKYPAEPWWPQQWQGKHTMRSAIRYSVVPFYREIAARIGKERMAKYVGTFNYGNNDISSGSDNFWLAGSLAVSAVEEIAFLVRFYRHELGVSPESIDAVRDILIQEKGKGYTLSGKTGGGDGFDKNNPSRALGWYVGYVEKNGNVYFFALNIEGDSFADIRDARMNIAKAVLKQQGVID